MATTAYNPLMVSMDLTAGNTITASLSRPLRVVGAHAYVTTAAGVATSVTVSGPSLAITDDFSLGNNVPGYLGRATSVRLADADIAYGTNLRALLTGAATAAAAWIECVDNS